MWPHSITIGLDGQAIAVGSDDAESIDRLEPWRIEDVGEPRDYCLELHPPSPGGRGQPRPLPGLYHGSTSLLRSRDAARVATALLRVLASHARPPGEGQVRIALMPVVRNGVAILAPPATIGAVPDRWMAAEGIEAIHTVSSLVDARAGAVLVDPPLGTHDEPPALAFGGWWLPPLYWDGALSPGFAVAQAMQVVTKVTAANATSVLRAVAMLVERAHPTAAPQVADAVKEGLITALERATPP